MRRRSSRFGAATLAGLALASPAGEAAQAIDQTVGPLVQFAQAEPPSPKQAAKSARGGPSEREQLRHPLTTQQIMRDPRFEALMQDPQAQQLLLSPQLQKQMQQNQQLREMYQLQRRPLPGVDNDSDD